MRKTSIVMLLILLSVVLVSSTAYAISGACVNCHTMHDSQNGTTMQFTGSGPQPVLLRGTCMGCHGQTVAVNIVLSGNIPQIKHTNATDLAAGNFSYITLEKAIDGNDSVVVGNKDTAGHNVVDIGNPEGIAAMFPPPGDEHSNTMAAGTFTCAGTLGCHGNRATADSMTAIKGAHHANVGGTLATATTVANSYRFLLGVMGYEDTDWQATTSYTDHNEYKGAASMGTESTSISPGSNNTISGLCAECHGNFHGPTVGDIANAAGAWLRHPTDIVLPNSTEYQYYNTPNVDPNRYSLNAPVARTSPGSPSGTATPGTDIVMCLSCHKSHASANADILRWDYEDINAGGGGSDTTRCFICHTTKD